MAEGKNKLYITISDERGGGTPTPTPTGTGKDKDDDSLIGRYIEHEMFHLIKGQATQAVNFCLNNIGNFTGDYIAQTKVNDMRKNLSGFMNIGMATIAGAKTAGLPGAIIGFAVGTISEVSSSVFDILSKQVENSKTNYEIEQLRIRAGLNSVLDGSRGTEN